MLALQMTAPPPEQLHAALARCFAAPPVQELPRLLGVLEKELWSHHTVRRGVPVPRAVLSRALWKLAEAQLNADGPAPARLARLLPAVFGCTLEELRCLRGVRARPWQVMARDFGVLDYAVDSGPDYAEISLTVDCPFAALQSMLDPARWVTRAALFWSKVGPRRSGAFSAGFKLPSAKRSAPLPVRVTIAQHATSLGFDAEVTVAARDARAPFDCVARITAETPRGGAWTTRVTQRKQLRGGRPIAENLAYWTQAETLCLALPM
jgi:hypothetical protein